MKSFLREKDNFTPIPFWLFSNQDHVTPAPGNQLGYMISVGNRGFEGGLGRIRDTGHGSYDLTLVPDPYGSGPRLILIPASSGTNGFDSVYFRVDDVAGREVAPIIQDEVALALFAMVSDQDHVSLQPNAAPIVTISRNGVPFQSDNGASYSVGHGFFSYNMAIDPTDATLKHNQEVIYLLKATSVGCDVTYEPFQVFRYHQPA